MVVANKWDQVDTRVWTEERYIQDVKAQLRHVGWARVVCTTAHKGGWGPCSSRWGHLGGGKGRLLGEPQAIPASGAGCQTVLVVDQSPRVRFCSKLPRTVGTEQERRRTLLPTVTREQQQWKQTLDDSKHGACSCFSAPGLASNFLGTQRSKNPLPCSSR